MGRAGYASAAVGGLALLAACGNGSVSRGGDGAGGNGDGSAMDGKPSDAKDGAGGGGGIGGMFGDAKGGAGGGGTGGASGDCCAIQKLYDETFAKSLGCDPSGSSQCTVAVDPCLQAYSGGCKAYINSSAASDLKLIGAMYTAANCYDPMGPGAMCNSTVACNAAVMAYFGSKSCLMPPKSGNCNMTTMKCEPGK